MKNPFLGLEWEALKPVDETETTIIFGDSEMAISVLQSFGHLFQNLDIIYAGMDEH